MPRTGKPCSSYRALVEATLRPPNALKLCLWSLKVGLNKNTATGACLLSVELLCLQSIEVLVRRTFPLQAKKLNCRQRAPTVSKEAPTVGKKAPIVSKGLQKHNCKQRSSTVRRKLPTFADFYFRAAGFFRGSCRRFFPHFCGKSAQKNPPAKSSKIYTTKIPGTFLLGLSRNIKEALCPSCGTLSGPVLRDTARLSQR